MNCVKFCINKFLIRFEIPKTHLGKDIEIDSERILGQFSINSENIEIYYDRNSDDHNGEDSVYINRNWI